MAQFIFILLILFFGSLVVISFQKIYGSKNTWHETISWGFLFGFFVWEDVIFISLYFLGASLCTFLFHDVRIFYVSFLVYWIIRGIGETVYYMSLQFHESKDLPHSDHWREEFMKKLFGDITYQKSYILVQVFVQVIASFSGVLLIFLLMNWNSISKWF